MARRGSRRSTRAPKRVSMLPKGGKSYSAAGRKAAASMQKQYGAKEGKRIFYALANKRAGKGVKGAHRMHGVANAAYKKGSKFGGKRVRIRGR